ncbi:hypothetical protein M9H77_36310 [Catharanthus roseus]|uniref:Uncharacterized protein n=1 Tax=Catharanthus roseus TaxID=4058 RepID=A0ACB9ZV61_CATRO|nr:hypothetical protein M9H77_36310 [Catharanthus roseus]
MNQDGLEDEKLQGPITRARAKRIKEKDDKVAHGLMIAIEENMKEGLKFKNEGLEGGNPPKLLIVQCLNLEQPEAFWKRKKSRRGKTKNLARGCDGDHLTLSPTIQEEMLKNADMFQDQ